MELSDSMVASLEEFVNDDTNEKLRQKIISSLTVLQQRIALEAQKLQSPQDYQKIEATITAVQSAILVMMMIETDK